MPLNILNNLDVLNHNNPAGRGNPIYSLVEDYSLDIVYSGVKRSVNYTGSCLRVRREADNSELDIGFVNNVLDTATLEDFGGYNLTDNSEDYTGVDWSREQVTVSSNQIANPLDSTVNVDKVVEDSSVFTFHRLKQTMTTINGEDYTLSFYVKAGERDKLSATFGGAGFNFVLSIINLATESITNGNLTNLGDGWYRVDISTTGQADSTGVITIELNDAGGARQYNGDGSSGLYVWGVQVVHDTVPRAYQSRVVGASNCKVVKWYNQGSLGSSRDATQTTQSQQPLIHTPKSGVETLNGKPTIFYEYGTGQNLAMDVATYPSSGRFNIITVHNHPWSTDPYNNNPRIYQFSSGATLDTILYHLVSGVGVRLFSTNTSGYISDGGAFNRTFGDTTETFVVSTQFSNMATSASNTITSRYDGQAGDTVTVTNLATFPTIDEATISTTSTSACGTMSISEVIITYNDISGDIESIENNINSYYNVY